MPIIGSRGAGSASGFGQRGGAGGSPVDYLVVAGGGSGGGQLAGGAGAGGYRTSSYGPAPLQGSQLLLKPETQYTVTVGAGASPGPSSPYYTPGNRGGSSIIGVGSPIEFSATGGGAGKSHASGGDTTGGSGGGGGIFGNPGSAGNLGGYTPPEGTDGGDGGPFLGPSGTGGGALNPGGTGGGGAPNTISGADVTYGQGGGPGPGGGSGYGGGGGGGLNNPEQTGGAGTAGINFLRFPTESKSPAFAVAPGSNTSTEDGDDTIVTFTVSGTFTL
tara:strand:+ start:86 stop:907 length:822 start_codon:yes stop_codon:yes gene_type:complete